LEEILDKLTFSKKEEQIEPNKKVIKLSSQPIRKDMRES
jgi:hypothetical protein